MNPDSLYGGLSADRKYIFPDYPASAGWSVKARLIGGTEPVEIPAENAACVGNEWRLTVPASLTNNLASGNYTLMVIAFNATHEHLAAKDHVRFFASTETDLRSQNRRTLDALNAMLEGKATRDQTSLSINGRSISRMSWPELLAARDNIARQVQAEEARLSGRSRVKTVYMRLVE
jgi:hypothetical protein